MLGPSRGWATRELVYLDELNADDAVAIASYLGTNDVFDRSMASFAEAYADQNERDHTALQAAVDSSKVTAEFGVLTHSRLIRPAG
jgi:Uncharacterized protein conserved in bacteria (DUF2252)